MKIKMQGFLSQLLEDENLIYINGERLEAQASQKLRNHSPSGFAWGYGGSGPAQLALAILLKYLPAKKALVKYQDFKWEVIAKLPQTDFETEIEMDNWIGGEKDEN